MKKIKKVMESHEILKPEKSMNPVKVTPFLFSKAGCFKQTYGGFKFCSVLIVLGSEILAGIFFCLI